METACFRLLSKLLALREDVGIGDDSFNTHLFHFRRRDNLKVRVYDREKSRSSHHLVSGFEFSNSSCNVFVDYFKCYCHLYRLGKYLPFESFDDAVIIFHPGFVVETGFYAGLTKELFSVPVVFLCNLRKKKSGAASK